MTAGLLLLVIGVWLGWPTSSRVRLRLSAPGRTGNASDLAAISLAVGVAVLLASPVGVAVAVAAGLTARAALQRLHNSDTSQREALARQAPDAIDCLASCLVAGAPLWSAIRVVAVAFEEPVRGLWTRAADRQALGSPPEEIFAEWLRDPLLAPVGRLLVRSAESGGSLAISLIAAATRLRDQRAEELEVRAQAVGVKAVAPLGLCFLPAFVLLAVVPIVGSLVVELL
jgi:pilus assembly protein TadC